MNRGRFVWLTGLLAGLSLLLTGCWDRMEINDLAIVRASSVDLADNGQIEVALEIAIPSTANPSSSQGGATRASESFQIWSAQGKDLDEALMRLQRELSRRLVFSHRNVTVFGEEYARKGIGDSLDRLGRDPSTRLQTYAIIAKGMTGKDFIAKRYPLESTTGEAVKEQETLKTGMDVNLRDFFEMEVSEGASPYLGIMEWVPPGKEKNETSTYRHAGTAIFEKNRLTATLSPKETEWLMWLKGRSARQTVTAELPNDQGRISLLLTTASYSIQPSVLPNGRFRFTISLYGEGNLYEIESPLDMSANENLEKAEASLSAVVELGVSQLITRMQSKRLDILGFGQQAYRAGLPQWRKVKAAWPDSFSESEFKVHVQLTARSIGQVGPALHIPDKELIRP